MLTEHLLHQVMSNEVHYFKWKFETNKNLHKFIGLKLQKVRLKILKSSLNIRDGMMILKYEKMV